MPHPTFSTLTARLLAALGTKEQTYAALNDISDKLSYRLLFPGVDLLAAQELLGKHKETPDFETTCGSPEITKALSVLELHALEDHVWEIMAMLATDSLNESIVIRLCEKCTRVSLLFPEDN